MTLQYKLPTLCTLHFVGPTKCLWTALLDLFIVFYVAPCLSQICAVLGGMLTLETASRVWALVATEKQQAAGENAPTKGKEARSLGAGVCGSQVEQVVARAVKLGLLKYLSPSGNTNANA